MKAHTNSVQSESCKLNSNRVHTFSFAVFLHQEIQGYILSKKARCFPGFGCEIKATVTQASKKKELNILTGPFLAAFEVKGKSLMEYLQRMANRMCCYLICIFFI